MHAEAYRFVRQVAESLGSRRRVLEIGSRNVNGTIRGLFHGSAYLGIDTYPGAGVDLVANGATFCPAHRVDTVVCCEVLEHTGDAEAIVANALRLLTSQGVLLVTCAAPPRPPHSAVDGGPIRDGEYYQNVPPSLLQDWTLAHGGEVIHLEYAAERGDVYLWARKA